MAGEWDGHALADKLVIVIASPRAEKRRQWTQELSDGSVVTEVGEAELLAPMLQLYKPAILLLDQALCQGFEVEAISALQRSHPATKLVLLVEKYAEREVLAVLEAGAKGVCPDDIDPLLLRKAIERVQKGEIWVERRMVSFMLNELASLASGSGKRAPDSPGLRFGVVTRRERQVIDLVGLGASNKQIADRLNITERTVKAHLTSIFRKLGVADRLHLAILINRYAPSASLQPSLDSEP